MLMRTITFSCGHLWLMTRADRFTPTRCLVCGCDVIREETEVHVTMGSYIGAPEPDSPEVDPRPDAVAAQRELDSRTVTWLLAESGFRMTDRPGPLDSLPFQ